MIFTILQLVLRATGSGKAVPSEENELSSDRVRVSVKPSRRLYSAILQDPHADTAQTPVQEQAVRQSVHDFLLHSFGLVLLLTLGLAAFVLAAFAEFYNSKPQAALKINGNCIYFGDSLHIRLGVAGGLTLLVLQLIITVPSWYRSFPARSPAAIKESAALTFLADSWVAFLFAFYYYMSGVLVRAHSQVPGNPHCYAIKPMVYFKAGAFDVITTILAITYYMAVWDATDLARESALQKSNEESLETVFSAV